MSNIITIEDNNFFQLLYHPDIKAIHHIIHRQLPSETLRNMLMLGVQVFKEHGATKWLSDDRHMDQGVSPEDEAWGVENWSDLIVSAGWKYWAILVPDTTAGRVLLRPIIDHYFEKGVRINLFTTTEEALEWLTSMS